jgi:iron uptake system component EfeO
VKTPVTVALCALATLALGACGLTESSSDNSAESAEITVTASDDACALSATEAPSGTVSFKVENTGSKVTEFYLYGGDGEKVVGEVENIGPGLSRDLVVTVDPGDYITACKPGMTGDGIRAPFTVTDSAQS